MNLASKKAIQNLLQKYQGRPLKRLGQNFLIDKMVIKKLIRAVELQPKDIILEIGPGIGTLTIELAKKVKRVTAIEKDPKMVEILKETLKDYENVEIVKGDILKTQNSKLKNINYKVVGNLPFYLTAPVIRKFLELPEARPRAMVLVIQKEVGQRICAKPPDMNLLAVSVQFYAKPEIISYISKKSFWPQPKVDSAIFRITPPINADRKLIDADLFFRIVKAGFSHPRKQLINNLSRLRQDFGGQAKKINKEEIKNWLLKNNIRPSQRAETLSVGDWINLLQSCKIN